MQYSILFTEFILFSLTNSNDPPPMSGFYTEGLDKVLDNIEIVYPEKVAKDGSFVSHYLPHFYDIESVENRPRRTSGHIRNQDEAIHFYVPIEGESNHLELWPNLNFISPGLVVERRDARDVGNVNKAKITHISSKQCHYNGRIVGKPDSSVALSTCYGLAGYIRAPQGEEYFIEPIKDSKPEPNKEHPHIIYKRSGMKDGHGASNCLTKGKAKENLEERMKWEAIYGDQVRKELSGTNINELVRDKSELQKSVPVNPPLVEKLKYNDQTRDNTNSHNDGDSSFNIKTPNKNNQNNIDSTYSVNKEPINIDSIKNEDSLDSKTLNSKMEHNPQAELQNENLDNEIKKKYFGNKLKHSSVLEEKNMKNIKFPEESLKSLNAIPATKLDSSHANELHNSKIKGVNEGKIVKRDLKLEENKYSILNTDDKQNVFTSDKTSKSVCGETSAGDTETNNNKFSNLGNTVSKRRTSSSEGEPATDSNKNKGKIDTKTDNSPIEQPNQTKNNQSLSKDKNSLYKCDDSIKTNNKQEKYTMSQLKTKCDDNSKVSELLDKEKKHIVHRDTSDEVQQINDDVNNAKLKEDQINNKKPEQYTSIKLPLASSEENEHKTKKEIPDNLGNIELFNNDQFKANSNPIMNNGKYSEFENIHLTNNKESTNDKSQIPVLPDTNNILISLNQASGSALNPVKSSKTVKYSEQVNPSHGDDIVIRIKVPEGSNIKSSDAHITGSLKNEQYNHLEKDTVQSLGDNQDKRVMNDNDIENNKNNRIKLETEAVKSVKGFESQYFEDDEVGSGINENGENKVKRHDNTIHLIIETEPEIINTDANMNSKSGLFCQGKNCLEIKPILLNDSSSDTSAVNNNTNTVDAKPKTIQKRQAWDDECQSHTTTERPLLCFDFYNKLFNLELFVAVDYKVVKMHEDDDIENFILTVINMVSTNFFDRSIGINLAVILVRLIILTTCIKELDSDRFNPEELLENFCTWQILINPGKDDHPHHHDLAILVTKMDKCEGQVLGVTYMTSICRPDKACLVCVDEGLLLANTITHQIGHSLGAEHDDGGSSGCSSQSPNGNPYHMAPVISETMSAWSACSKDAIIQFIKTQGSWCLTDQPIDKTNHFPLMLPGQIYSAAQQCRLNYHMTAIPCAVGSFCTKLYCQITEKICATKGDPPADGTFCAADMWCFHKQCVHIGRRPGSVNGEWGPWTEWSVCTRSCGGGVSTSFRICNNPKPENGGRFCIGDRIRHRMCATKACQGFTESFRDLQCKKTEDKAFRGRFHNWIQYHSHFMNIECSLVCQNRKGDVVMRSPIVADGTPCKAGTRNVCIQGTCRNVGCDWVIDSKSKEDACGVCHGNSTECRIIQGIFDEQTEQKGLVEFLKIPKGSGMIFVREIASSANVIVVSGGINRVFYLNGVGSEDSMPGDVSFGLTHGVYEIRSLMERVFIRGPTTEDLIFYVLFREPNKGIHFQYAIPETDPTYVPRYLWQYIDWDQCTDPCSGGSQRAHAKCVEDRGGVVDDQYCTVSTQPMDVIRPCNDFPCQAKWWVSVWSDCICTGSSSVMFRSVLCMRATDESGTRTEIVKEAECALHKKPPTQKPCNVTEEDTECVKRSAFNDHRFGSRKFVRRAVNPKTAYSAFNPSQELEKSEEKEKPSSTKSQRSAVKPRSTKSNVSDDTSKEKSNLTDKGSSDLNKNNVAPVKENNEAAKSPIKEDELPAADKGKQLAKLNDKNIESLRRSSNVMKNAARAKQSDEVNGDANISSGDERCSSTTPSAGQATCATQEEETTEASTCKLTSPVEPHDKTTCCKTTPRSHLNYKTEGTTTLRPIIVKFDDVNMDNFVLTVVPVDIPGKKKLPLTDPEFINLGKIGQFGVGDEKNGTILSGQEAVDFLDFARGNASEEPVVLHEEMHNN